MVFIWLYTTWNYVNALKNVILKRFEPGLKGQIRYHPIAVEYKLINSFL